MPIHVQIIHIHIYHSYKYLIHLFIIALLDSLIHLSQYQYLDLFYSLALNISIYQVNYQSDMVYLHSHCHSHIIYTDLKKKSRRIIYDDTLVIWGFSKWHNSLSIVNRFSVADYCFCLAYYSSFVFMLPVLADISFFWFNITRVLNDSVPYLRVSFTSWLWTK